MNAMGPIGRAFDLVVLGSGKSTPEAQGVKVQPAYEVSAEKRAEAQVVPARAPETTVPGAALIPARAPDVVVTAVPAKFSWGKTLSKVGGQMLVVVWSVLLPLAADAVLDAAVRPGFLEGLGLPPSVPVPFVYLMLGALRDYRRHKRTPPEAGG